MDNTHIVYRNRFEKDADEFWHSETGTTLILVFLVVLVLAVIGLVVYNRKRGY
jgi:hypothetical protein